MNIGDKHQTSFEFSSNGKLRRRNSAHLELPFIDAEKRDLDGAVGEQILERQGALDTIRQLDDKRFIRPLWKN